jgi:hypothetical protein
LMRLRAATASLLRSIPRFRLFEQKREGREKICLPVEVRVQWASNTVANWSQYEVSSEIVGISSIQETTQKSHKKGL